MIRLISGKLYNTVRSVLEYHRGAGGLRRDDTGDDICVGFYYMDISVAGILAMS